MTLAIESAENDEPVSEHHMMALLLQSLGPEFQPMETLKYLLFSFVHVGRKERVLSSVQN